MKRHSKSAFGKPQGKSGEERATPDEAGDPGEAVLGSLGRNSAADRRIKAAAGE